MIDAKAGRDNVFVHHYHGPDDARLEGAVLRALRSSGLVAGLATVSDTTAVPAHEQHLSDQLDRLRDGAKDTHPDANLALFRSFLNSLPADASATIRFRAKANIGLQHLARGEGSEAIAWLIEACDEAPEDPRAVANRALALFLRGDAEEAYRSGLERLASDPTNEVLASYLPQIAVKVDSVMDGLDGIPEGLRNKEAVMVGQAVFLRGRNLCPQRWEWARTAAEHYPDSDHLKMLVAFSYVARSRTTRTLNVLRSSTRASASALLPPLPCSMQTGRPSRGF